MDWREKPIQWWEIFSGLAQKRQLLVDRIVAAIDANQSIDGYLLGYLQGLTNSNSESRRHMETLLAAHKLLQLRNEYSKLQSLNSEALDERNGV